MQNQTVSSLPSATVLLSQAWAIYKQKLNAFLGITAIPALAIAVMALAVFASGKFFGPVIFAILSILSFAVFSISQTWGQIALLYAIKDRQEKIGVIEAYRRGWHKIFSYWWVSALTGLIILGGFLLLIVPGIIFTVWFSFALFVLITEDLRGAKALSKSKEYVRGNWSAVFWRLLFIWAIFLIIYLAPTLVFKFLEVPLGPDISKLVIGLFLTPLIMTYSFLLYGNLKAIKSEIVV